MGDPGRWANSRDSTGEYNSDESLDDSEASFFDISIPAYGDGDLSDESEVEDAEAVGNPVSVNRKNMAINSNSSEWENNDGGFVLLKNTF